MKCRKCKVPLEQLIVFHDRTIRLTKDKDSPRIWRETARSSRVRLECPHCGDDLSRDGKIHLIRKRKPLVAALTS